MSKKLTWILVAGVVVLLLVAIIGRKAGWIGSGNAIKVSTEKVTRRNITERVAATGKIFPQVEVKISPDVSGEIVELPVAEGDSVVQGQLLAKIKPDIYIAQVDRAVAALNNAKANYLTTKSQLTQAQSQFDKAQKDYDRNKKLFDQKVIAQSDFDQIVTLYQTAKASLDGAQQNVDAAGFMVNSAQASLKEANDQLTKTSIYAPMSGVISKLSVEKGERVVGTTQFAGTEMLRIANLFLMEARVDVSENDVLRVNVGDTSEIEVDAYPDRKFKGIVYQVANSANSTESTLTSDAVTNFTVKILLDKNSYADLVDAKKKRFPFLPGMSASVQILTNRVNDVLAVPIQSVTTREDSVSASNTDEAVGSDKSVKEIVFVYTNGKAKKEVVTTGIQDDEYIEIKSGLKGEEELVTAPYSAISRMLKDGSEVKKVKREELFTDMKN